MPKTKTLEILLHRCEHFLRNVGESFWAENIDRLLGNSGEDLTPQHIQKILSWYGGMGSFNDLMISHRNGHDIPHDSSVDQLNTELCRLRDAIYHEAMKAAQR